jgi:hypothetical protein
VATLLVHLPSLDKRDAIPIFRGVTADKIAAAYFRRRALPFDHQYIPVHNAIHAVLSGDWSQDVPSAGFGAWGDNISRSHVETRAAPHPFREDLRRAEEVFVRVAVHAPGLTARGGELPLVVVREGEDAGNATARWAERGLASGTLRAPSSADLADVALQVRAPPARPPPRPPVLTGHVSSLLPY